MWSRVLRALSLSLWGSEQNLPGWIQWVSSTKHSAQPRLGLQPRTPGSSACWARRLFPLRMATPSAPGHAPRWEVKAWGVQCVRFRASTLRIQTPLCLALACSVVGPQEAAGAVRLVGNHGPFHFRVILLGLVAGEQAEL